MIRYFRLVDDMMVPRRWHLGNARLTDGTVPPLDAGIRFESPGKIRIPVTHFGRALDFSLTSFGVPVLSLKLATAIAAIAPNDIQIIPVCIGKRVGMVVLNAVQVLRCIDDERSEYVKWTASDHRADLAGQYRRITKLVLSLSSIPSEVQVFRIAHSLVELVVSETVKSIMESVGCIGAEFIELQSS